MRKLVTVFAFALFASTFGFAALPASAAPGMMMGHRCHRGMHWIPAHRDRRGHWVRAHCGR